MRVTKVDVTWGSVTWGLLKWVNMGSLNVALTCQWCRGSLCIKSKAFFAPQQRGAAPFNHLLLKC